MADTKFKNRIKAEAGVQLPAQTANRALITNASGEIESTTVTDTELGYLSGVTSNIQDQLDTQIERIDDLTTLSGVPSNSMDLGTFTGTIIPDNSTVKAALQSLETSIETLPDPIVYKGTWDASTNTPALSNADTGRTGWLYQVTVAGAVDFGAGSISFEVGDKVVNNGTAWEKWDMTDAVTSVNGQTGAVVLDSDDISEGTTNLYFSDEKAQDAVGAILNNTATVSLSYADLTPAISADVNDNSINGTKIRLENDESLRARNAADNADVNILKVNASDELQLQTTIIPAGPGIFVGNYNQEFDQIYTDQLNTASGDLGINAESSASPGTGKILLAADSEITQLVSFNGSVAPTLEFTGSNSAFAVGLKAPDAQASDVTFTLPGSDGTSGQAVVTDGAGNLSFQSVAVNIPGDIQPTSFSAANNQTTPANVTGLAFSNAAIRSFEAHVNVVLDATSPAYEVYTLRGIQKASGWDMDATSTGDDAGVVFSITNAGQVQYTSANSLGFVSLDISFRAITLAV